MEQCPKCGRYMTWYMVLTKGYWKCVCGYDTRSITYTWSDRTEMIDEPHKTDYCPNCGSRMRGTEE